MDCKMTQIDAMKSKFDILSAWLQQINHCLGMIVTIFLFIEFFLLFSRLMMVGGEEGLETEKVYSQLTM